ncbi:ArsR/SmtB family transcription factor [Alkalicoccus urumqiensis]|uniref:ArsR family transcriptional regulator n=1 Tax=Alkalicoccus urumqiensis TaxID=1548213 RepID=A0A2P6MJT9_ALKUR|nr:helix-turn-helix domain-containing protein [Alkalicoccus urumqiensis]PRO66533.1 ArsR family transcriptional regulator [Alkalicoccus urumqiensis]
MKQLDLTFSSMLTAAKALANETRIDILRILSDQPQNVNTLADKLGIPFSTTASHVSKLEKAGLISTELVPGRGTQKVSAVNYDQILIQLHPEQEEEPAHQVEIEMPVGEYHDCRIEPHCGLVGEQDYIGRQDDPRSFYEPERMKAQLVFFKDGFVEYRFPNRLPGGAEPLELSFSAEICSEAPNYKMDWPSDITCWVNQTEVGTWTSPADFGGTRGTYTPSWWRTNYTQYGELKEWVISREGSFLDGKKLPDGPVLDALALADQPFISFRMGIKETAEHQGGMNIFGPAFGNHPQGIIMKMTYE